MKKNSSPNFRLPIAEKKREEETGTSLFHRRMAQRKNLKDDSVCMKFFMSRKTNKRFFVAGRLQVPGLTNIQAKTGKEI